jgi:RNA polymerase sigma-70 factor, ECF subfamily
MAGGMGGEVRMDDRRELDQDPSRGSDPALLSELYRERLVAYAHKVLGDWQEAEDVVQEVFLRTPKAARLRDAASLAGWLYAVCYRIAIDKLRARNRRAQALESLAPIGREEPVTSDLERREEEKRVRDALERLEEPYRTAVRLRYLGGLDFREVASRLGTIERTARTWVGRGLSKLKQRLGA